MTMHINIQHNVPLAPFTTYQIGGPADQLVEAHSSQELVFAVEYARSNRIPYFVLGTGANILVADQGFRGLVIVNKADAVSLDGGRLTAESGAVMADVIERCRQAGWSGLEHFAGIPSSVGGALWQNLHFLSPDRSRTVFIAEVLSSAQVLLADGRIETVGVEFFQFGYDQSILHHQEIIVLAATFQLQRSNPEQIGATIDANLAWRQAKHPPQPSCGSVFQKIEGVGAGRLIDQVGLKGRRIGGAEISPLHANFIVNQGGATAQDVIGLMDLAYSTVQQQLGYQLRLEIGLVGDFEDRLLPAWLTVTRDAI